MDDNSPTRNPVDFNEVFDSSVYASRPWHESYPPEVARSVESSPFSTLAELFKYSAGRWPERTAFSQFGQSLSYAQVWAEAARIKAFLHKHCTAQDRVAVMLPNCLAQPIIFQAVVRARMVVVNINPQYTARELNEILSDARPVAVFIWDGALPVLHKSDSLSFLPKVVVVSLFDYLPTFKRVLMTAVLRYIKRILPAAPLPEAAIRLTQLRSEYAAISTTEDNQTPDPARATDVAVLQYTGGTTGLPKGATLTHGNLIANVMQLNSYLHEDLKNPDRQQVVVTPLPLYHIFALMVNHLLFWLLGAENRLIANPRQIDSVIKILRQTPPFNVFVGVNTLFQALLNHQDFASVDFSGLHWCIGGGMQVREETAHAWRKQTGQELLQGYGLTEASPVVCFNPYTSDQFNGSVGLPIPGTDVMIIDEHDRAAPFDSDGELLVRGAQVMSGYWNKPDETAACLSDGWLRTGDMARMDKYGYCYIVDRIKDIINISGFKVYPNEIESVVESHEQVRECACVGVRAADGSEQIRIAVVRVPGSALDSQALHAWLKERLTPYKRPRYIEWVDSLAKTNVGKVLRRVVRQQEGAVQGAPAGVENSPGTDRAGGDGPGRDPDDRPPDTTPPDITPPGAGPDGG